MKILIVSGFLGAGKTTFIKELIQRSKRDIVILENEYGQNDLDAQEIEKSSQTDLKLLEFMEGCVCCTQKDKFTNTILTISAGLDPDYLLVEPTGVAKLSSLIAGIEKVSYDKIRLLKPLVVLSPENFQVNMANFSEIYRDQIYHASQVVLSKCEHSDPALIATIQEQIHRINPHAQVLSQHYSLQEDIWWEQILEDEEISETVDKYNRAGQNSPTNEISSAIEEEAPSDFLQCTFHEAHLSHPSELLLLLEDILHYEFGNLPRAKGTLQIGQEWFRFSLADRLYSIIAEDEIESPKCQLVFIGKQLNREKLMERLHIVEDPLNIFKEQKQKNPSRSHADPSGKFPLVFPS